MINVILVLVSVAVTLGYVVLAYWVVYWRSSYQELSGASEDLVSKLEDAEEDRFRAENELKVFKDYLAVIASRTINAQLTDEQVARIAQHIASSLTPKGEMN
jgi:hypothetical protein